MIPVNLAVEDVLSECVLKKILEHVDRGFAVGRVFNNRGNSQLKKNVKGYNHAATSGTPFVVLTDLDEQECPLRLIDDWFGSKPKHHNLIFRVAVREVEAWLLADRRGFARSLGLRYEMVPNAVETIEDPKRKLFEVVQQSRLRTVKDDILPSPGAHIGRGYNSRLCSFVSDQWNIDVARSASESLDRAVRALERFTPSWSEEDSKWVL